MSGSANRHIWILAGCLAASGCSGTVNVTYPSVTITSPAELATVEPGTDAMKSVPVEFTVQNFTLKDKCNGATNCGHVVLMSDMNNCKPFGQPYNNKGSSSPIDAHFSTCNGPSHSIVLELHHDDDSAELDQNKQPVQSQTIVIELGTPDAG